MSYGATKSCTCQKKTHNLRHGHCRGLGKTKAYTAWASMKARCGSDPDYLDVRVCAHWEEFENFLADVGEPPTPKHEIDRIDSGGHYEPGNVRWATEAQQARNRRFCIMVDLDGRRATLKEHAAARGLRYLVVYNRVRKLGQTPEMALSQPTPFLRPRPRRVR